MRRISACHAPSHVREVAGATFPESYDNPYQEVIPLMSRHLHARLVPGALRSIAILIAVAFLLSLTQVGVASDQPFAKLAPINPKLLSWLQAKQEGRVQAFTSGGQPLGYVPGPIDLSYMKGVRVFDEPALAIPASYDLRTKGKVTSVKNQGACGSCWAFASMGSIESRLLTGESRDFSEWHMCQNHGWDWGQCDGGNQYVATAYLSRWAGPYNETDFPYPYYVELAPNAAIQKHVQDVYWLPGREGYTDNNAVKQAIMKYGGVSMDFFVDDTPSKYFNSNRTTYYMYDNSDDLNHEVLIVGWDNNYSKTKFQRQPSGNGAFLIKNSWGTGFHDQGYFWMSYYDRNLSLGACFTGIVNTSNYGGFYYHDPLGCINWMGYGSSTSWAADIYKGVSVAGTAASKPVKAVGTYFATPNTAYEIYVYTNLKSSTNPKSGTLATSAKGKMALPGYHTVTLPKSVAITSGKLFSVVIKFTTPGYNYPIPVEYKYAGVTSKATAQPKQSFFSGNGTTWEDATKYDKTMNTCIKAFTAK